MYPVATSEMARSSMSPERSLCINVFAFEGSGSKVCKVTVTLSLAITGLAAVPLAMWHGIVLGDGGT